MRRPAFFILLTCLVIPIASSAEVPRFSAEQLENFETSVRPLLAKRCFSCHGGDSRPPKGGLRLDSRSFALKGGDTGPAIQPGNPAKSLLIDAINYGELYQMPPKAKMTPEEIRILTAWVADGAPWPDMRVEEVARQDDFNLSERQKTHWAWQAIEDPKIPRVRQRDWPSRDLDHFILKRLERARLVPAPPASRYHLIRRAHLDLIGLPPTPEQVKQFVADTRPDAFERLVDELLDSPHFGERWARHWMDLARYAETYGHEGDYPLHHAHQYRDYLIRALNADVPYDRFITEQIAGDLLDEPRIDDDTGVDQSILGTTFWWLGEATHSPVDVKGDEAGRIDNQLDVFSKTFLGLTIACARCHDHKFDAISTRDYYSLAGFLQSSRRYERAIYPEQPLAKTLNSLTSLNAQAGQIIHEALKYQLAQGGSFSAYLEPARRVSQEAAGKDEEQLSAIVAQYADAHSIDAGLLKRWATALGTASTLPKYHPLQTWDQFSRTSDADLPSQFSLFLEQTSREKEEAQRHNESYVLVADFEKGRDGWLGEGPALTAPHSNAAHVSLASGSPRMITPGRLQSGALSKNLKGVIHSPTFELTHRHIHYLVQGKTIPARAVIDGHFMFAHNPLLFRGCQHGFDHPLHAWTRQAGDVSRYVGHRLHLEFIDASDAESVSLDEVWLSDQSVPPRQWDKATPLVYEPESRAPAKISHAGLSTALERQVATAVRNWGDGTIALHQVQLINWLLENQLLPMQADLAAQLDTIASAYSAEVGQLPSSDTAVTMMDGSGEDEFVFIRGNHKTPGQQVARQMITALRTDDAALTEGSGRLRLAHQVASADNPLTARVMANRVWHHLQGRGIVASVDNFGVLGQRPTHPELLDHLASRFIQNGWSIKSLIREVMLSSTYAMSSNPDLQQDTLDPENLLWPRAPMRRLQGEVIRDSILAISGRLSAQMYGPSVNVHLTQHMPGRGSNAFPSGPLDGDGRRSIYIRFRRNFISPMMQAFDTPIPFSTVGRRNVSNVPAQALILLNDPFVIQQAQVWGENLIARQGESSEDRIAHMYRLVQTVPPTPDQVADALDFLRLQASEYGIAENALLTDARLWRDLGHVLWNTKPFIYAF